MKVTVTVEKGSKKGKQFEFVEPMILLIGRGSEAHLKLNEKDKYVSRRHCLLEICPPRCVIIHISKTNETEVNGESISEKELKNGDIISVGYTKLRINIEETIIVNEQFCAKCEKKIQTLTNTGGDILCDDCELKKENENENDNTPIRCLKCNSDLTELANSDKKAKSFGDSITYLCEDCLPESEYLKGEKIGKYDLIKFIAEGGMGMVYLVYDRETARLLVQKKISGIAKNEIAAKHFIREINIHKKLRHPNIIQFIDNGIYNKEPFLVLEYANNGNIEDLIMKSGGTIPIELCLKYFHDALKGLVYIHSLEDNILHRDIKPDNILLHKNKSGITAKITDFGIAKPYRVASGTTLTRVGENKGTILFMSPEQILDVKNIDQRSDIFSMGVTFYYMLTGKMPYEYPSVFEFNTLKKKFANRYKLDQELRKLGYGKNVIDLIICHKFIPIESRLSTLNQKLANMINRAMKPNVANRYQKAIDFLNDLEEII